MRRVPSLCRISAVGISFSTSPHVWFSAYVHVYVYGRRICICVYADFCVYAYERVYEYVFVYVRRSMSVCAYVFTYMYLPFASVSVYVYGRLFLCVRIFADLLTAPHLPVALSRTEADSPFGMWGYGDGRAMSIGHAPALFLRWVVGLRSVPTNKQSIGVTGSLL